MATQPTVPGPQYTGQNITGVPNGVNVGGPDPGIFGLPSSASGINVPVLGGPGDLLGKPNEPNVGGIPLPLGAPGAGLQQIPLPELIQEFYQLPVSQQIAIEQALYAAGFYEDAAGNPLKVAPQFGVASADTVKALQNAATQAMVTGTPLNTVIQQNIAAGVGSQQQQQTIYKPGVVAHGYRNVIDLRNPQDVQYAVETIAERFLGHKASDQDVQATIQQIQSQDFADGMAKYNAQEQMSQLDFQAQVANRDAAVAYATGYHSPVGSPSTAGLTNVNIQDPGQFAVALLQAGGWPVTQSNVAALIAWESREGGNWNNSATFNPLNTTQTAPGASSVNGVGVKAYTSWGQGVAATVQTLNNGNYSDIVAALASGDASKQLANAERGLNTWSGGGYANIQSLIAQSQGPASTAVANAGASTAPGATPAPGTVPQVGPNGTAIGSNPAISIPGLSATGSAGTAAAVGGGAASSFIAAAESQVGVPYQWGGESPGQNFDCSGLVQWAMKSSTGIDPGRTTYDQIANPKGAPVSDYSQAQPGDLLFFNWSGGTSPDHVAIYLGNGQMLDADHTGDTIGIRKSVPVGNIVGIRRFGLGSGQSSTNIVGGNDVYVPGSNTIMTQPGTPEAAAYARMSNPSPTNPDYPDFMAQEAANQYGTMLGIIKSGGTAAPTTGGTLGGG